MLSNTFFSAEVKDLFVFSINCCCCNISSSIFIIFLSNNNGKYIFIIYSLILFEAVLSALKPVFVMFKTFSARHK